MEKDGNSWFSQVREERGGPPAWLGGKLDGIGSPAAVAAEASERGGVTTSEIASTMVRTASTKGTWEHWPETSTVEGPSEALAGSVRAATSRRSSQGWERPHHRSRELR